MSDDLASNEPIPLSELAEQEHELQLVRFHHGHAWALGLALVEAARALQAGVVVDIERGGQQLFHAALPGTAPDNDYWIRRKGNVVRRFGHSSLHVGQQCREQGTTFEAKFGLPSEEYAAHGGAFPLVIRDVGPVGVVAVSGLPQVQDHRLVVAVLRDFLAGQSRVSG